jgi:hypothetical protein
MREIPVEDGEPVRSLREWERKLVIGALSVLVIVFGAWAGVVWNGTEKVVAKIDDITREMSQGRLEQEQYRTAMERRMTIQEQQIASLAQRQLWVIETLRSQSGIKTPP